MSAQLEIENLIDFTKNQFGKENWTTVYEQSKNDGLRVTFYSSFVKKTQSKFILNDYQWDVSIGHGLPTNIITFNGEKCSTKYQRYSSQQFPPLVIARFFDIKEPYLEIAEEFRFFHNLYFDSKRQIYLTFDDAGDEIEVIRVSANKIEVKTNYLYKFLVDTQINLVLYFEFDILDKTDLCETIKTPQLTYNVFCSTIENRPFTRMMGKKLITCSSIASCLPNIPEKIYQDFYIGGDEMNPTLSTCNPEELDDFLIRKINAPGHYLTPVFFKKEVLSYYHNRSSEYVVTESTVSRKGSWFLSIDNHSTEHISVYLGDLGRLPMKIQLYWKSFNLIPDGHTISDTYYKRTMLAQFSESTRSDHIFKQAFSKFFNAWNKKFGWNLFKPLSPDDEHHFLALSYILTNEQSEFDLQIGSLAKMLVDSINSEEIQKYLGEEMDGSKSIINIEKMLYYLKFEKTEEFKKYLQKIQTLRSTGSAHRKSTQFQTAIKKYQIDRDDLASSFNTIFLEGSNLFSALYDLVYT